MRQLVCIQELKGPYWAEQSSWKPVSISEWGCVPVHIVQDGNLIKFFNIIKSIIINKSNNGAVMCHIW